MSLIRKSENALRGSRVNFKGGTGTLSYIDALSAEEMAPHGRKFGITTMPVGASIGYHVHDGDSEVYHVLSGKGIYNNNGTEIEIAPGDTTVCYSGEGHGLRNEGTEPLVFAALILFDA